VCIHIQSIPGNAGRQASGILPDIAPTDNDFTRQFDAK